jgi:hypothetical protein
LVDLTLKDVAHRIYEDIIKWYFEANWAITNSLGYYLLHLIWYLIWIYSKH